tara:strand:- start:2554 stop:2727 length:174 start_codon:yes stop_codon:yes gene_type:complete
MIDNLKTINTKYLVVTYFEEEFYNSFRIFKHKDSDFFSRYSKVIEITFRNRTLIIEF